jgi:hypothetical protein
MELQMMHSFCHLNQIEIVKEEAKAEAEEKEEAEAEAKEKEEGKEK